MTYRLFSVLGVLLVCLLGLVRSDRCVLHEDLTRTGQWETKISKTGRLREVFIRFSGDYMNRTTYGPNSEDEITRECVASQANNKYVFKWTENERTKYQCYQLVPISRSVVVMRNGLEVDDQATAERHCLRDETSYYEWPLVSTNKKPSGFESNLCGMEGGFEFYTKIKDEMRFCQAPDKSLKPKLEVGCSETEHQAMNFDFRNFICKGLLELELKQKLSCLGHWKRGGYTFTVVTNGAVVMPKVWLLRLDKDPTAAIEFEIQIFPDIRMDMDENPINTATRPVHTFVTRRNDFADVCEDEAHPVTCNMLCELNSDETVDFGLDDISCLKSCGKCPKDQGECNFPKELKGDWERQNKDHVVLTSSVLYVNGLVPMKCLNLTGSVANKQPVVSYFRNGCKPEYRCAELHSRGPNVIQYSLSDTIIWPYRNNLATSDICSTESSNTDRTKILIKDVGKESVYCGIHGTFAFTGQRYNSPNQAACSGLITACDFKNVFRVEYSAECGYENQEYNCIASYEDGESRFVITESEDNGQQQCWSVHKFESDPHTTMHQLALSECYADISLDIRYRGETNYKMQYNISGSAELDDDNSCNRVPKTGQPSDRMTSSTPTSQPTTAPIKLVTQNIPPNKPTTEKPYTVNEVFPKKQTGSAYIMEMNASLVFVMITSVLAFLYY